MSKQIEMPQITLKAARVNVGLNLVDAAKKLNLSPTTLIKWEKHPGDLTPNQQRLIGDVYNFPTDYIFFGDSLELKSR